MINKMFTTDQTLAEHRRNLVLFNSNSYMTRRIQQTRRNSKIMLVGTIAMVASASVTAYSLLIYGVTQLKHSYVEHATRAIYNDEATMSFYTLNSYNSAVGMRRLREKYSRRELMRTQIEQFSMRQQVQEAEVKLAKIYKGMS